MQNNDPRAAAQRSGRAPTAAGWADRWSYGVAPSTPPPQHPDARGVLPSATLSAQRGKPRRAHPPRRISLPIPPPRSAPAEPAPASLPRPRRPRPPPAEPSTEPRLPPLPRALAPNTMARREPVLPVVASCCRPSPPRRRRDPRHAGDAGRGAAPAATAQGGGSNVLLRARVTRRASRSARPVRLTDLAETLHPRRAAGRCARRPASLLSVHLDLEVDLARALPARSSAGRARAIVKAKEDFAANYPDRRGQASSQPARDLPLLATRHGAVQKTTATEEIRICATGRGLQAQRGSLTNEARRSTGIPTRTLGRRDRAVTVAHPASYTRAHLLLQLMLLPRRGAAARHLPGARIKLFAPVRLDYGDDRELLGHDLQGSRVQGAGRPARPGGFRRGIRDPEFPGRESPMRPELATSCRRRCCRRCAVSELNATTRLSRAANASCRGTRRAHTDQGLAVWPRA